MLYCLCSNISLFSMSPLSMIIMYLRYGWAESVLANPVTDTLLLLNSLYTNIIYKTLTIKHSFPSAPLGTFVSDTPALTTQSERIITLFLVC